ncbi:MAG: sulfite exporter TauE/SafE family protein [Oscillospiraceae bacterium]|nr:sulfite exporter TauE/SafE family protein [Oscillospiraceae bacterium]
MGFIGDAFAGAITGVITGFGIGGGTLLILYLTLFGGFSQTESQGINLLYFIPSAGSSLVSHIKNRCIEWRAVIFATVAGCATTLLGSIVASKLDVTLLRRIFGAFLLCVGISELFFKKRKK